MVRTEKQLLKTAEQIFRTRKDKSLFFDVSGGFITTAQYAKISKEAQAGYAEIKNPFVKEEKATTKKPAPNETN